MDIDDNWVKKCVEFRVEGRRPIGRPRRTWLESVEADMAELEIDKEDVHDIILFQTTQLTSGGAVTAVPNCCANCVEASRPQSSRLHEWTSRPCGPVG